MTDREWTELLRRSSKLTVPIGLTTRALIVKDTSVINYPQAFRWFRKANCRVSSKTFGKRLHSGPLENFGCTYDQRFRLVYTRSKRSQKNHWALNTRQSNAIYSRQKWPHSLDLNWKKNIYIVCQYGRSYAKKYELTELANQKASFHVLNGERPWKSAHVSVREWTVCQQFKMNVQVKVSALQYRELSLYSLLLWE